MIPVPEMPFGAAVDLSDRRDCSMLEQSHEALARIESELCQKLKAIAALPSPTGMDEVQWESTRAAMEAQAKTDAEKEKVSYKAILQFSDQQTSELQEAEKKIAALLHQEFIKNVSLELDLSGLLLHSVPEAVQKLFSTLVKLDLSSNNLKSLAESVTSLVNLTHLDLHSNQLTSLPNSIGRLVKLKALNVSGNSLAALPDSIGNCRALEELSADFNQLTWLPEAMGFELLNLRKLSVHSNRLMHLPYSTSHMMSLRFLDVHMNRLGGLPEDLENLMNLEYLDLSSNFNYLVALPESIGELTSLIELNISYNQIIALPESIGRLEKLQRLKVEENPLVIPPPQVVNDSVAAIKEYLAERLKARRDGVKRGRHSCLGRMSSGQWATPSSDVARALSWQEYRNKGDEDDVGFSYISTPRRRGRAFFSRILLFSPWRTLPPLGAFPTTRHTARHVHSPFHI